MGRLRWTPATMREALQRYLATGKSLPTRRELGGDSGLPSEKTVRDTYRTLEAWFRDTGVLGSPRRQSPMPREAARHRFKAFWGD